MGLSGIQMPTVGGPMESFQMGQQLGAGNNPLTALGQAIKGTVDTYKTQLATQAAADVQSSKNQNALDVQRLQNQGAANVANATGNRALDVKKFEAEFGAPSKEEDDLYKDMQLNPTKYAKQVGPVTVIPHVKVDSMGRRVGADYRDVRTAGVFDMATMGGEPPAETANEGGGIGFNPFTALKTPQVAGQGKVLTPDIVKQFVAQAKGDPTLAKQLAAQAGYK